MYFEIVFTKHGHHVRSTMRTSEATAHQCVRTWFACGHADRATIWRDGDAWPVAILTTGAASVIERASAEIGTGAAA